MTVSDQRVTNDPSHDSSGKSLIDCHVHLAALPDAGNGCDISPKMLKSPLFRVLLWKHDLSTNDPKRANQKYLDDRGADAGAVLVKVLPNAQQFDPADSRYKAFYRALAEHRLPLLSHVGYEFSLIGKDQSVGDPARLRAPLEEGVTVIAAHACSDGLMRYEKFLPTFRAFVRRYQNFYADISALTLPNRLNSTVFSQGVSADQLERSGARLTESDQTHRHTRNRQRRNGPG